MSSQPAQKDSPLNIQDAFEDKRRQRRPAGFSFIILSASGSSLRMTTNRIKLTSSTITSEVPASTFPPNFVRK